MPKQHCSSLYHSLSTPPDNLALADACQGGTNRGSAAHFTAQKVNSVRRAAAALRSGLWPPKLSLGTSMEQVLARRTNRTARRATLSRAQDLQHLHLLPVKGVGHNTPAISPVLPLSVSKHLALKFAQLMTTVIT